MIIPHPDRDNTNGPDNWSKNPDVAKFDAHDKQAASLASGAIKSVQIFAFGERAPLVEQALFVYDQLAEQIASSGLSTVDQIALLETVLKMDGQQKRADADANANLALAALVATKPVREHVASGDWNTVSLIPPKTRIPGIRIPEFFRKK
jgi:hypothetical protein